eukprot:UN14378
MDCLKIDAGLFYKNSTLYINVFYPVYISNMKINLRFT